MTKICFEDNFNQIFEAITRLEQYVGLDNSTDINTLTGKIKDISTYVSSGALDVYKVVKLNDDDKVEYANSLEVTDAQRIIGVSLHTTSSADDVIKVQSFGRLQNTNWNFDTNLPVMLGENGSLTQTCPTSGFWMSVGRPISSDELLIQLSTPIILNEGN